MSDTSSETHPPYQPPPYYANYPHYSYQQPPPGYYQPPQPQYVYLPAGNESVQSNLQTNRNKRRKQMMYIAIGFCAVAVLLLLAFILYGVFKKSEKSHFDACEDFYSHACAEWKLHNLTGIIENGLSTVQKEVTEVLIRALRNNSATSLNTKIYAMIAGCLNEEEIEMKGKTPLVDLLDSLGGWPVVEGLSWTGNMDKAMEILGDVTRMFGSNGIFAIDVMPNMLEDLEPVIYVQGSIGYLIPITPSFPFTPKFLPKPSALEKIVFDIVKIVVGDGNFDRKFVQNEVEELIKLRNLIFETKVKSRAKPKPELITINDLTKYTKMNWNKFLHRTFFGVETISGKEKIFLHEKQLLKQLSKIIRHSAEPRTFVNLIIFFAIRPLLWHLSSEFQDLFFRLNEEYGFKSSKHRLFYGDWCVHTLMECLPYLITKLHAEKYFQKEDLDTVSDITTTIINTYVSELNKNDWLTQKSKTKIVEKIRKLKFEIAFPDIVQNDQLDDIYNDLFISDRDHFQNVLDSWELSAQLKFAFLINDPKSKSVWRMPPLSVNAWFMQFANMIQIFAGLLRAANVTSKSPLAHQYGVLGSIIAHEVTHALDFYGLKVDENGKRRGNLHNLDGPLLDAKSAKQFIKKTQCIASQYRNYCYESKCIDGDQTINENLADISGTRIAFLAFMKKVENKKLENFDQEIPKEIQNGSPKKQFFYYFARIWCTDENPDFIKAQIEFDSHSPNKFRVIGTLANMPEFSAEFGCEKHDEMNKKKKCKIW